MRLEPNFVGHSPEINLADSWPVGRPPVLWSRELGQGYSGFVAADGRVYTQYYDLASILGVEPEHAFDVPTARSLMRL